MEKCIHVSVSKGSAEHTLGTTVLKDTIRIPKVTSLVYSKSSTLVY